MSAEDEVEHLKRELQEKEAKRRSEILRLAAATLLTGIVGLFFALSQLFNLTKVEFKKPPLTATQAAAVQTEVNNLKLQVADLEKLRVQLSAPNDDAPIAIEHQRLSSGLAAVDERLQRIEAAIVDSPERALSIPLLRKDIDESMKRQEEYRASIRSDIDRLYEQQKWMLGGIGTALLAIIGGALTAIFRFLPKPKGDDAQ